MTFYEKINSHNSQLKNILPLFHSTDVFNLRSILMAKELKISKCQVFNESLLYSFFGRPAYYRKSNFTHYDVSTKPVCIIIDPNSVRSKIFKIYPFDTGAFHKMTTELQKYFHPGMKLKDFELGSDISIIPKFISYFYHDWQHYLKFSSKEIDKSLLQFELNAYHDLLHDNTASTIDVRMRTIEISFNEPITLDKANILGIILPNSLRDDFQINDYLINICDEENILDYFEIPGNPESFRSVIYDLSYKFIRKLCII